MPEADIPKMAIVTPFALWEFSQNASLRPSNASWTGSRGGGGLTTYSSTSTTFSSPAKKTNKKNKEQHEADLMWGYNQILMAKADIPKTAIVTPFGLWEFLKMRHSDLPTLHGQDRAGP